MQRVFCLIRDKLGDSIIAFCALHAFVRNHPEVDVTVMAHEYYLPLFEHEEGLRLVPYRSSTQAYLWAFWQRVRFVRYDAVVVLCGFGRKVARLARILHSDKRIHARNRHPDVFVDSAPVPDKVTENTRSLMEPHENALRVLDPDYAAPDVLSLPGLTALRIAPMFIGVCPVTDEARKNLGVEEVRILIDEIRRRHPGVPVRLLTRKRGEHGMTRAAFPDVDIVAFGDIRGLIAQFAQMRYYYGADTGLYHLAVAMGIGATVFFGPTQPYKIIQPAQKGVHIERLALLGQTHCDCKSCRNPVCISLAVEQWSGRPAREPMATALPEGCLLRPPEIRDPVAYRSE